MKVDPIIAVKDVEKSSKWYQAVFGCRSIHGGSEFDVLVDENDEVLLCVHKWGAHDHPTMKNPKRISGNGLILYIRTARMEEVYRNVKQMGYAVEVEIELSPNSGKKEFSVKDPDGYYLTIADLHNYEG